MQLINNTCTDCRQDSSCSDVALSHLNDHLLIVARAREHGTAVTSELHAQSVCVQCVYHSDSVCVHNGQALRYRQNVGLHPVSKDCEATQTREIISVIPQRP